MATVTEFTNTEESAPGGNAVRHYRKAQVWRGEEMVNDSRVPSQPSAALPLSMKDHGENPLCLELPCRLGPS